MNPGFDENYFLLYLIVCNRLIPGYYYGIRNLASERHPGGG